MTTTEDRGWNVYRLRSGEAAGRWVLQYRVRPGEWKETRVPREYHTQKQAERYAAAWIAEWRKNKGELPLIPEPDGEKGKTIRDLADDWLDLREKDPKLSPAIRKQNSSNMKTHVLSHREVADVPIVELGPAVLRGWVRKVRDHGLVTRTKETGKDGEEVVHEERVVAGFENA